MSKYKIKPLVAEEYSGIVEWDFAPDDATIINSYFWRHSETFDVCIGSPDMVLGTATTIAEAQAIVDKHHREQVTQMLDSLLEPPQWQTGPIPEPTGFSVLVVELKSGALKTIPVCSDQEERYWSQPVNGYTNNRWYIQPITLPTPSQQVAGDQP